MRYAKNLDRLVLLFLVSVHSALKTYPLFMYDNKYSTPSVKGMPNLTEQVNAVCNTRVLSVSWPNNALLKRPFFSFLLAYFLHHSLGLTTIGFSLSTLGCCQVRIVSGQPHFFLR